MGETVKERAAKQALLHATKRNRMRAERYVCQLRKAPHMAWLSHSISQPWGDSMPPHEVYTAALVASHLSKGGGVLAIPIGHFPGPDKDVQGNNEKLATMGPLCHVDDPMTTVNFYGTFWGGNYDADGYVGWEAPVRLVSDQLDADDFVEEPRSAPLEVGYVRAWQVWFHLVRSRCFARWPYGHDTIYVFVLRHDYWRDHVAVRLGEPKKSRTPQRKRRNREELSARLLEAAKVLRAVDRADLALEIDSLERELLRRCPKQAISAEPVVESG